MAAGFAGLVTSVHCAGMCGPIGCAVFGLNGDRGRADDGASRWAVAAATFGAYHLGRLLSYSFVGFLAGALGSTVVAAFAQPLAHVIPWLMVGLIAATVLRVDRWLPKSNALGRAYLRLARAAGQLPPALRGGGLGLATPLLPCGPLYLLFTVCLFAGDPMTGALYAGAFALGTIPLLLATHAAWLGLGSRVPPRVLRVGQVAVAVIASGIIAWRLIHAEQATEGLCVPM